MRVRRLFVAVLFMGVLLVGAPLFSQSRQRPSGGALVSFSPDPQQNRGTVTWFRLDESQEQIVKLMGPPAIAVEYGADYVSWQYRLGGTDIHDSSHTLVFRRSTRKLVSVTRTYEPERVVDEFFPDASSQFLAAPGSQGFSLRIRRLPGGRVLAAMGLSKPGQSTGQLMIATRDELRVMYPWIDLGPDAR